MTNQILLKRTATAGKVPALTDIAAGELCINTADGKVFMRQTIAGTDYIVDVVKASMGAGATIIKGLQEVKVAAGINGGNALSIDCSAGNAFVATLSAAITAINAANIPPAGTFYGFLLELVFNGVNVYPVTWSIGGVTVKWGSNTPPTLTASPAAGKKDAFVIYTYDGGVTWTGAVVGQNL